MTAAARAPIIAGNIKMNLTRDGMASLLGEVTRGLAAIPTGCEVVACPPFPHLPRAAEVLSGSKVALGGQDMHWEDAGAFTGEVSPAMLREAGCRYVILGHSERRTLFGETDDRVRRKAAKALSSGLIPIVCVGETQEERQAGSTGIVLARQAVGSLGGIPLEEPSRLVVAYEPVWAIGTGNTATPEQAQDAHRLLRAELAKLFGSAPAERIRILYGGSVKPDNAAELLQAPDLDGALVGGASLAAASFLGIVRALPGGSG